MRICFLLFLLISACGPKLDSMNPLFTIDSDILPYVNSYIIDKKFYMKVTGIKNMDIVFKTTEYPTVGQCLIQGDYRKIEIDPYRWFVELSDTSKKLLIYHELGHCDLNLGHSNAVGIMSSSLLQDYIYLQNPTYYIKDLFTH